MRVRDMRRGRRVRLTDNPPVAFRGHLGKVGVIQSVAGRIAAVRWENPDGDLSQIVSQVDAALLVVAAPGESATGAASTDSPELAAYKLKVAQVARRLGREHNMCSVLNDGLREIGIEPLPSQDVVITLRIPEEEFNWDDSGDWDSIEEMVVNQIEGIFSNSPQYMKVQFLSKVDFTDKQPEGLSDRFDF